MATRAKHPPYHEESCRLSCYVHEQILKAYRQGALDAAKECERLSRKYGAEPGYKGDTYWQAANNIRIYFVDQKGSPKIQMT